MPSRIRVDFKSSLKLGPMAMDAFSDGSAVANFAVSGISCTALADATVPSSYAAEVSSQHFAWSSGHRPSV